MNTVTVSYGNEWTRSRGRMTVNLEKCFPVIQKDEGKILPLFSGPQNQESREKLIRFLTCGADLAERMIEAYEGTDTPKKTVNYYKTLRSRSLHNLETLKKVR